MKINDFFILCIKLFGLYCFIITLFDAIPTYLTYASFDIDTFSIVYLFSALSFLIILFLTLIKKAGYIEKKLKLSEEFESDRINLDSLNASIVVKIGSFVIGGLLFINNLPHVLSGIFIAFKQDIVRQDNLPFETYHLITNIIKLFLGYWLVTNYSKVDKSFKKQSR